MKNLRNARGIALTQSPVVPPHNWWHYLKDAINLLKTCSVKNTIAFRSADNTQAQSSSAQAQKNSPENAPHELLSSLFV